MRLYHRDRLSLCLAASILWLLAGCNSAPRPVAVEGSQTKTIYVIERDWHTDVAFPAQEIDAPFTIFKRVFPDAQYFVFGFGDRAYVLSRETTIGVTLSALFPGPGAMLVTALKAPPQEAFPGQQIAALQVSEPALRNMSSLIWRDFDKDSGGQPLAIGNGPYPGSVFYSSSRTYDGFYTCNTWSAEMLEAGGFPINSFGVVFAAQVMRQVDAIARRQSKAELVNQAGRP